MVIILPGYRLTSPNLPRRLIVRSSGTHLGAWILSKSLCRIDRLVLRLTAERRTFTSIATGLPAIVLVTTGTRSGRRRMTTVLAIPLGEAIAVLGDNFGQPSEPAWAHNLAAHPAAEVEFGGHRIALDGPCHGRRRANDGSHEGDRYLPPYAAYLQWTTRREVPVLVLEPRSAPLMV